MHRIAVLLASATVLSLVGCASGGPAGSSSAPNRVVGTSSGMDVYLNPDDNPTADTIPAEAPDVWTALVAAYGDLGVEVGTADPTNRILGNRQLTAMHRLGGEPLARYFDCGSAGLSGQVADQARLTIDLYTQLQPVGAGTLVATHATAQAKPINGAGASFAGCRSTGELEKRIAELVRKHLAG